MYFNNIDFYKKRKTKTLSKKASNPSVFKPSPGDREPGRPGGIRLLHQARTRSSKCGWYPETEKDTRQETFFFKFKINIYREKKAGNDQIDFGPRFVIRACWSRDVFRFTPRFIHWANWKCEGAKWYCQWLTTSSTLFASKHGSSHYDCFFLVLLFFHSADSMIHDNHMTYFWIDRNNVDIIHGIISRRFL